MSMSAFTQHDAGVTPAALGSQEAVLLELLSTAGGKPVSYGELHDAGIELPASMVSGLELAGVPIVRCFLGEARGAGVRLGRAPGGRPVVAYTTELRGAPAVDRFEGERLRDRLTGAIGEVVGSGWAWAAALAAWLVCFGLPGAKYAVRWSLRATRTTGERAYQVAGRALGAGVRSTRQLAVAIAVWFVRVVPPATDAASGWLSRVAHVVHARATSASERAYASGRAACEALTRAVARIPPWMREAARRLDETTREVAESLRSIAEMGDARPRGSIAEMGETRQASRGNRIAHPQHPSRRTYPPGPPGIAVAPPGPSARHQTRNRCLAFSALAAVSGVVLAVAISDLSASAGGARRLDTHRHHNSRIVSPNVPRRSQAGRTNGATN